jgi:hypothetical protein
VIASWWRRLTRPVKAQPEPGLSAAPEPVLKSYSGEYKGLHKYLRDRYASRVVLSFEEIEDLLGFALPGPARLQADWWGGTAGSSPNRTAQSDSWTLASRTATVNLPARNVLFERS